MSSLYTSGNGVGMHQSTDVLQRFSLVKQVGAAAFYGIASILIITVNKVVLTSYK